MANEKILIADDEALMQMLRELSQTKKLYEKVQTALEQVKATGYGIVMPGAEELKLEKPEIVKKNGNYAVKLRAVHPHDARADRDGDQPHGRRRAGIAAAHRLSARRI